jgi:Glycosyl transferases group 1
MGEPPLVEWRDLAGADRFRAALRRARVYIGSARWEDFGQAPLEALADGTLLVTVPSGGPFEALRHARELAPQLVAGELSAAALAPCIEAAFALGDEQLRSYREEAARRIREYAPEVSARTVEQRVLPALFG